MSARNTFVTQFIYGPGAIADIEKALSAKADSLSFFGNRQTVGYFSGIIASEMIGELRSAFTDFNMAVMYDK